MTVENYTAEEYGIGYEHTEPIAPSADDYSQYPPDYEAMFNYQYRDIVKEVFHETGYHTPWALAEMGIEVPASYAMRSKSIADAHDIEKSTDTRFHVRLEGHEPTSDGPQRPVQYGPWVKHVAEFDGDPLSDKRWLKQAVRRNYSPAEIAALFLDLTAEQVEDRLVQLGYIEQTTIEVGGETIDLEEYHNSSVKDPRLLAKLDSLGLSIPEVAETLGVTAREVEKQARLFKLTE